MTAESEMNYDDRHIATLEDIWGEGFLSPGGPDEMARVIDGLDLTGKRVLDIGCGSGAIAVLLAQEHGAAEVIGIDVEDDVVNAAKKLAEKRDVADRVTILKVAPGPLVFDDQSFDVVFSKDSIIHIPDKEALCADVFRILVPGGWFAASDWLMSHDGEPSPEMKTYIDAEDLDFAMASPERYERALVAAGFVDVGLRNRNPWYRDLAREELAYLEGEGRDRLVSDFGAEFHQSLVDTWEKMIVVLNTGEHCPHHLRGRRPA